MSRKTPDEKVKYPNTLRQHRKVRIESMSVKIGVSIATIYRWEAGTHYPNSRGIRDKMFKSYRVTAQEAYPTVWQNIFPDCTEGQDE